MNGCHEAGKLQDMLDGFIKKFVLCEKCENPETVLKVRNEARSLAVDVGILNKVIFS